MGHSLEVRLSAVLVVVLVACTRASSEDSEGVESPISGSIEAERQCAAASAYDRAELSDFVTLADGEVPPAVRAEVGAIPVSLLVVSGVGKIYVTQNGAETYLRDLNGRVIVVGSPRTSSSSSSGAWGSTSSSSSSSGAWGSTSSSSSSSGAWGSTSSSSSSSGTISAIRPFLRWAGESGTISCGAAATGSSTGE